MVVKSSLVDKGFMLYYIPNLITSLYDKCKDEKTLHKLSNKLGINAGDVLDLAVISIKTSIAGDNYIVSTNNNTVFNGVKLGTLLNTVSYGTRNVKGYSILIDIFEFINNNIEDIYDLYTRGVEWL